ncbi:MAG: hypothetical protein ABFE01_20370 [Phycisphaerales bacterium]
MRARTFQWIIGLLVVVPCWGSMDLGTWTVDGAFDYEDVQIAASWWPDPNGGVGLLFVTDSAVSEDTGENFALGPVATFRLDEAYRKILGTVLPAIDLPDVPLTTYGRIGVTWEINDSADMSFLLATGAMLFPDRFVQPTIWAEWVRPEGSADEQPEVRALFGVTIWLNP